MDGRVDAVGLGLTAGVVEIDAKVERAAGRLGPRHVRSDRPERCVVVGVVDSGFDIHHQNFRKPDGTTRILALWDQTIEPDDDEALPGEQHPANFSFGVEYDDNRINGGTLKVQ